MTRVPYAMSVFANLMTSFYMNPPYLLLDFPG